MAKSKRLLDDSSDEEEAFVHSSKKKITAQSQVAGSSFGQLAVKEAESSSSDEEGDEVSQGALKKRKKLGKEQKKKKRLQDEEQLREAERARLKKTGGPENEDEYRELLQSNTNCSATWIQYICHLLSVGEVDRAHSVARRGLAIISAEEQKERINLWTVLLRIEVKYRSSKCDPEKTLIEACNNCDDFVLLNNMAGIYEDEGIFDKAEALYLKLTKKFYAELDVWVKAGNFYYKNRRLPEARELLNKALIVLKKRCGPDITCRFAKMEFEFGESEKGCGMFESLLVNYPKRLDIWNVYADVLVKHHDIKRARDILTRMTSIEVNLHKKNSILRKLMEFEKAHGDERTMKAARELGNAFFERESAKLEA